MEEYVTKEFHQEFEKRILEENTRQNHRISALENDVRDLQRLTTAVEKMAVSMDVMAKEQGKISLRLDVLEDEPAEKWKKAVWLVLAALIGAGLHYLFGGIV